jgi:hypothetical protein
MVPQSLLEIFKKIRPDLIECELTESKCCEVLVEYMNRKVEASDKMSDLEVKLTTRVKLLQEELTLALGAGEDIKALKSKAAHIMDQFTRQRELTQAAEAERAHAVRRTDMLVAHIEKLMKCLKIEAASKIKMAEANRRERQLTFKVTAKLAEKEKVIMHQKKLVMELKEGSYVLEGQLRLMDERFFELRNKLDTARANQKHQVEKAERKAKELRKKFGVIHGPRHTLDEVVIPELPPFLNENTHPNVHTGIITEFDTVGVGFTEGSMVGGDMYVPPGKIRPGTAAMALRQSQNGATDPHASLRENLQLRNEIKKAAKMRPSTAPPKRPQSAAGGSMGASNAKTGSMAFGFHPSGDDKADVDKIISRIYNKHTQNKASKWTPEALADLVRDETGKVTCPIPDLRPAGQLSNSMQYESDRMAQMGGRSAH